ncbi:MAG: 2-hydroxychromene-2-carboxylate isomerase [Congregibacter sp.]
MQIEFYFDVGSPTAYLAYRRLQQLKNNFDLELLNRPMLLGGVFKAAGNSSPVAVPAKARYMLEEDLPRFASRYDVALNFNPHFPVNTLNLMRGVFAARQLACEETYLEAVFTGTWIEGRAMGDAEVVNDVLLAAGVDSSAIAELSSQPAVKQQLIDATEAAVARGVFGAPTLFVGNAMFFGQDRLDFVEQLLAEAA